MPMRTLADESLALMRAKLLDARDAAFAVAHQAWRLTRHTLRYADWRAMELFIAVLAVAWGLWLLLTPFSVLDRSEIYRTMVWVATRLGLTGDGLWGFLLVLGGVVQFVGFYTESLRVQQSAAIHLAGVWTFMWVCYLVTDPGLVATVALPFYVAPCAWVHYRVTSAARHRDRRLARRRGDRVPLLPPDADG